MIFKNERTLFGGKVATIVTPYFISKTVTAKEGLFKELSTVVCLFYCGKAIPVMKLFYRDDMPSDARRWLHDFFVERLNEVDEFTISED